MEHRHPYTARGVLTALGKSALYVLFFLGVQLLTGAIYAAIAIAGSALRPGGFDPQSILDGADTATLLADFFIAAGLLLWFKIRQTPLSEAVCLRRCSGWTAGFCSFAGIVLYVLTDLALSLLPEAWMAAYNADMSVLTSTGLNTFLTMAVLGPLAEELTFRGVIQTRLERAMPPWLALVLQAAIFGLVHGTPIQMVYAFLMGLAFGFLRRCTGSILPGFAAHAAFNAMNDPLGLFSGTRRRRSRAGRHGGGGRGGLRGVPARACRTSRPRTPTAAAPSCDRPHTQKRERFPPFSLFMRFFRFCKKNPRYYAASLLKSHKNGCILSL